VELALAKAVESIQDAGVLPGGNVYEMKWDGFRAVCVVDVDGVSLWSRQRKDLSGYFPDVLRAAGEQIPTGCVVDGELVVWSGDRLDFDALQVRLVTAKAALVRERPASFVVFDVLAVAGQDARALPFRDRRALLEELATGWVQPRELVVGLPMQGRLRIVGRSAPLSSQVARDLGRYLHPPRGKHPWPEEISTRMLDRFNKESGPVRLTLVDPIVVEVLADAAWSGRAFRHSVRLVRVRPELEPDDVQLPGNLGS
jgi:hypothetical protein